MIVTKVSDGNGTSRRLKVFDEGQIGVVQHNHPPKGEQGGHVDPQAHVSLHDLRGLPPGSRDGRPPLRDGGPPAAANLRSMTP